MWFIRYLNSHQVLVGHNKPLNSLLPHPEHLGALVLHQGKLLKHHILGRLDFGAQVEFSSLMILLILCQNKGMKKGQTSNETYRY